MENTPGRHSLAKATRHGEMDAFWHDITQVMDRERCVVGDDSLRNALLVSAPEGPADQVLTLARRKVAQAEDAATNPLPIASIAVVMLLAIRIACCSRLGGGEIASLLGSDLVQRLCICLWVFHPAKSLYRV
jgi:hypothetical protein